MSMKFVLSIPRKLEVCVELDTVGLSVSITYRLAEDWGGLHFKGLHLITLEDI